VTNASQLELWPRHGTTRDSHGHHDHHALMDHVINYNHHDGADCCRDVMHHDDDKMMIGK
jgi:hypothetical protein